MWSPALNPPFFESSTSNTMKLSPGKCLLNKKNTGWKEKEEKAKELTRLILSEAREIAQSVLHSPSQIRIHRDVSQLGKNLSIIQRSRFINIFQCKMLSHLREATGDIFTKDKSLILGHPHRVVVLS